MPATFLPQNARSKVPASPCLKRRTAALSSVSGKGRPAAGPVRSLWFDGTHVASVDIEEGRSRVVDRLGGCFRHAGAELGRKERREVRLGLVEWRAQHGVG